MKVKEKDKKDIVDLSTLNSDQLKAFESLRDYLSDKEDQSVYVLKGWAGTGKTYSVEKALADEGLIIDDDYIMVSGAVSTWCFPFTIARKVAPV